MNQGFRIAQRLMVSALLSSAVAMAAAGDKTDSVTKEHHSKMSKIAFWRHHNDAQKSAPQNSAKPAQAKQAQPKQAQIKPAAAKQSKDGKTEVKPITAKQTTSKSNQNGNNSRVASPFAMKNTAQAQPRKPQQKSMTAQNAPASKKE